MNEELITLLESNIKKLEAINTKYSCDDKSIGQVVGSLRLMQIMFRHFNTKIVVQEV